MELVDQYFGPARRDKARSGARDLVDQYFGPQGTSGMAGMFPEPREAQSFGEYLAAGWQGSAPGLAVRGKMPELNITEATPWYGRAAAGLATIGAELPLMIAGGAAGLAAGSAAGPVGSTVLMFAGGNALPTAIRQAYIESLSKGEISDTSDFVSRSMNVAWETFKSGAVGAGMGAAGIGVRAAALVKTGIAPEIATKIAANPKLIGAVGLTTEQAAAARATLGMGAVSVGATAAEVATMATMGPALEGRLPATHDFIDASVLLFGLKTASAGSRKLMDIYRDTGRTPFQVARDAQQDPEILANLKEDMPDIRAFVHPDVRKTEAEILASAEERNARLLVIEDKPEFLRTADERVLLDGGQIKPTPEHSPDLQRALEIENKAAFLRSAEERVFLQRMKEGGLDRPPVTADIPTADRDAVHALLRAELDRLGLGNIGLQIEARIAEGRADGLYNERVITIALDTPPAERVGVLNHEVIHALRQSGVFTDAEWAALTAKARNDDWVNNGQIHPSGRSVAQRYAEAHAKGEITPEGMLEEAIADANRALREGRVPDPQGLLAKFNERIHAFLEALANAFRGRGFITARDVLEKVQAGEIGTRGGETKANQGVSASLRAQTETVEFKRWFGDSKVVDADGKPLVVYHGTTRDFTVFDAGRSGTNTRHPTSRLGFWFTASPDVASVFTEQVNQATWPPTLEQRAGANVMPAHLAINNPFVMSVERFREINGRPFGEQFELEQPDAAIKFRNWVDSNKALLLRQGYDGIKIQGDSKYEDSMGGQEYAADAWVAFRPEQIKSAIGNRGTFDPETADIRYSMRAARDDTSRGGIPPAYRPLIRESIMRDAFPKGIDAVKLKDLIDNPEGKIPDSKQENYINFKYVEGPDALRELHAAVSENFETEIATVRQAPEAWGKTFEKAGAYLKGDGSVDTVAVRQAASNAIVRSAALDALAAMDAVRAEAAKNNGKASAEVVQRQETTMQMLVAAEALDQGIGADIARALNIRKAAKESMILAEQISAARYRYGGDPVKLAELFKDMDTAKKVAGLAKDAQNATLWQMIVEGWKAGLVSGLVTHTTNLFGTELFAFMRAPVDAVAAVAGAISGREVGVLPGQRLSVWSPVFKIMGMLQGHVDGLKVAMETFAKGDLYSGKAEHYMQAIPDFKNLPLGTIIRSPFRLLSAEDGLVSTVVKRGVQMELAATRAIGEGLHPFTQEFTKRLNELMTTPDAVLQAQIDAAGQRFTFNEPYGPKGHAVSNFVREWHLEWLAPFIRTPINIAEELLRMSAFAPLVTSWRDAFNRGGVDKDRAIAELALGSGIMAVTMAFAMAGNISGAGSPDPGRRRGQQAAGWQPYSVKIGDTWYSYNRLQPTGTLMGIAADLAEVWDQSTDDERDRTSKMLTVAFANAITNQTFLQGISQFSSALSDPDRYGKALARNLTASLVPNIFGQSAAMMDPVAREVSSVTDAVKARIPGMRQTIEPKIDVFGQDVQAKERIGFVMPVQVTQEATEKIRTELDRLSISVPLTPKKLHVGRGTGKFGEVDLSPEQRSDYARVSGEFARMTLTNIVSGPAWDSVPALVKRKIYSRVFSAAHRLGALAALPPEQRTGVLVEAAQHIQEEMARQ